MSGWSGGGLPSTILSYEKNSIITTPHEHDYIFQGKCFTVETFFTIASANTEYDIVFDTTACVHRIVALPTFWGVNAGDVTINLGTCSSYTAGTAIIPTNRSDESENTADVIFKYDVTPVDYVAGSTNILIGSKSTNQSSGGSLLRGELPRILKNDNLYLFRVSNNAGEEIKLYYNLSFYEIY